MHGKADNFQDTENGKAGKDVKEELRLEQSHEEASGMCLECDDQPPTIICTGCNGEVYCETCFVAQHRKGSRSKHHAKRLVSQKVAMQQEVSHDLVMEDVDASVILQSVVVPDQEESPFARQIDLTSSLHLPHITSIRDVPASHSNPGTHYLERSKFIPIRLTLEERKYLRMLEAALNVSEYTDKIDVLGGSNKMKRIVAQIKELCSILSGLVLAADYEKGQKLFQDKDLSVNSVFFQNVFELGRRHKIMNPEKMRATYGKLIYLLMDSQIDEVKEMLGFDCVRPLKTVYSVLEQGDALQVLTDPLIVLATMEIIPVANKHRATIQREIKLKESAIESLVKKYANAAITQEDIRQCIFSIADNHSYLRQSRDCCDKMLHWLHTYFREDGKDSLAEKMMSPAIQESMARSVKWSLSIQAGSEGARLTHDHKRQFQYVKQSLTLWRTLATRMFELWMTAEADLLNGDVPYRLRDTGQGLQRVQGAPGSSRLMNSVVREVGTLCGGWVGSSVVHLGDHNVPNAFMLIDSMYSFPHSLVISLSGNSLPVFYSFGVEPANFPRVHSSSSYSQPRLSGCGAYSCHV